MTETELEIMEELRTVYDPEIRVNIVDLGLIYSLSFNQAGQALIKMTLTAPNCPVSDQIVRDVRNAARRIKTVKEVEVELVWDPPWNREMMSEEGRLMLGYY